MSIDTVEVRRELRRRVNLGIQDFEGWYRAQKGDLYVQSEEAAVLDALDLRPDSTVIDAGCGGGRFSLLLAPRARSVRAIDFSPVAVRTTLDRARRGGLTNVLGEVADLTEGFLGEPADRIVSVQTLQHIPTFGERLQAACVLRDALRPGGRLVATVFNGGRWMDRLRGRGRESIDPEQSWYYSYRFTATDLSFLLELAGLARVRVEGLINLPGRLYRWPLARSLRPADRILGRSPFGPALGIYLLATGVRPG